MAKDSINPSIVICDGVAIVVACQLLGLLDAINAPDFAANGGWFQPVTSVSTLPLLVQRISINSVLWVASVWNVGGYDSDSPSDATFYKLPVAIVPYAALQLLVTQLAQLENNDISFILLEALRQVYVVLLVVAGARFLASKLDR